jgi:hypothetical protein
MDAATIEVLADLIVDLDRAGVQELVAEGDTLRFRPRSALTPDLVQRLRAHKAELLAALKPPTGRADTATPRHPQPDRHGGGAGRAEAPDRPQRLVDRRSTIRYHGDHGQEATEETE